MPRLHAIHYLMGGRSEFEASRITERGKRFLAFISKQGASATPAAAGLAS